jgi:Pentapeptide repeats (8 copies)
MKRGEMGRRRSRGREPWSAGRVGLVVMLAGLGVVVFGHVHQYHGWQWSRLIDDLYPNVGAELSGMAIVILLIDRFAARREDERLRAQLLRELGSADPGLTARAALELEAHGWLFDGTLSAAQLSGAKLAGVRLERAAMPGVTLAGADLTRANLSGAGLVGANFAEAVLDGANLEMADLTGALLPNARLRRADAALARFGGASLAGADLGEADLTDADLSRTDLRGAKMPGTRLDGARLDGAVWDATTQWPEGYVPPLVPMVPVAPPVEAG